MCRAGSGDDLRAAHQEGGRLLDPRVPREARMLVVLMAEAAHLRRERFERASALRRDDVAVAVLLVAASVSDAPTPPLSARRTRALYSTPGCSTRETPSWCSRCASLCPESSALTTTTRRGRKPPRITAFRSGRVDRGDPEAQPAQSAPHPQAAVDRSPEFLYAADRRKRDGRAGERHAAHAQRCKCSHRSAWCSSRKGSRRRECRRSRPRRSGSLRDERSRTKTRTLARCGGANDSPPSGEDEEAMARSDV